jgi:DNA repair exonuclease SbcCD nuclease subunit
VVDWKTAAGGRVTPNIFVHIGDVHLQHGSPRNADRLQAFDQIIAENQAREGLAGWLVPGDLFHQRSTADDRNALADRLRLMGECAPVVLVRGNHDQPNELDIFARLRARWPIAVVTRPQVINVLLPTGDTAAIAAVPYPDKSGLVAAGVEPSAVPQTAAQILDVIFMQLACELATARVGGAIPLFLGHFNTRGAVASTGQPQIGQEQEIDRLSLERLPAIYCALSHIHEPQEVGRGVYAGSIAAMDYGEVTSRSYVLVEAAREADGSWAATWTRQPINTPPMFRVDGRLTRHGFSVDSLDESQDAEIHRRLEAHDWAGTDVRARYRYRASERAVLDDAVVRDLFVGALRLKVEGIAEADRELRAPEVAAAKTLPDKLAAYRQEATLPASVAAKLDALEHQDPAQVLADVSAALAEIEAIEKPATVAA